ncbi:spermidine synthase [Streptomyces sp. NPDC051555]|uniref:spermidine synthase n=1 Tax=Streptomyces sp. NPDC051555 TaxID=3365657 RepID=UPI003791E322
MSAFVSSASPASPASSVSPTGPAAPDTAPVTIDRRQGPYGEVILRRRGGTYEIIANGCFLMDTSDGRSERLLVDAARLALTGSSGATGETGETGATDGAAPAARPALLIGGLGVGFSLAHASARGDWGRISVVEREEAVIDWHRGGPLDAISGPALADPRVEIVRADLIAHLLDPASGPYDALCLDIDNGPDWTVTEDNRGLYAPAGLAACRARLTPGGVLAVWSAQPSALFEHALRNAGFSSVRTEEVPVARGVPDVVHLALNPS